MTLEQPGLGSNPPNGSGRERGVTLCLVYEGVLLKLFDLKTKEELNSPIMLISNSLCIDLTNSPQSKTLVAPNIISTTYILTRRILLSFDLMKRVVSIFSILKPLRIRNLLSLSKDA